VSLYKICNRPALDGLWTTRRIGRDRDPDLQPGSSIMPGKVMNPVICEAVCQVCTQGDREDAAVAFGGAAGNFELNVMMPVIARNLLASGRLLTSVCPCWPTVRGRDHGSSRPDAAPGGVLGRSSSPR